MDVVPIIKTVVQRVAERTGLGETALGADHGLDTGPGLGCRVLIQKMVRVLGLAVEVIYQ